MLKVSVLYPQAPNVQFDIDYYCNSHIPMVRDRLGDACRGVTVEAGVAGGEPDAPAPFVAIASLHFDSLDAFTAAFGPHAEAIMADVPNYTNAQPLIQISELTLQLG